MTAIPFIPEKLTQVFEWKTAISKTHDGFERQRVCLRLYPVMRLRVEYLLDDGAALRSLRDALFLSPNDSYEVPLRHDGVYVTADVTTTTVRVPIAGSQDWAIVDRRIYVEKDDGEDGYATSILSRVVSGPDYVLTVVDPPPSTFPAAVTRACPAVSAFAEDGKALGTYRLSGGGWVFDGRVTEFVEFGIDTAPTTFDGYNVWTVPFEHAGEQQAEEFEAGLVWTGDAPFQAETYRTFSDIVRAVRFNGDTFADWLLWKALLYDTRGMQRTFLLPTWRNDVRLHTAASSGNMNIRVHDDPSFQPWYASTAHRYLRIATADGAIFEHLEVTSVVDNMDGTLTLNLDDAIIAASYPTTSTIAFLERVRLASDEVVVEHYAGGKFTINVQVRTVQQ